MKKGFTLIELLAVIVILAIIALIAVPIILSVINNTKEEAIVRSAENYLDAVELSIASTSMNDSTKEINGVYEIIDGGKRIQKDQKLIQIDYNGEGLESGTILIKDGKVKRVKNAKIGNLVYVKSFRGNTMIFNETPEDVTLMAGRNFNIAIKTLVGNEGTITHETEDTIVKSIEFLSYGKLPEGYTLSELQELQSANVSVSNDNKILAYYDGEGNIFIYSEGLINFYVSSNSLFQKFSGVESIVFDEIDTSNVETITGMFSGCKNLTTVDLTNFDTNKVTNMSVMFSQCRKLISIDVSNFDTSSVRNMSLMFDNCQALENINVNNFNTNSVTNMSAMFNGCIKLESLDLSNFDTSLVTTMERMFYNSKILKCIKVGDKWTEENVNVTNMFTNCGVSSVSKNTCPTT